MEWEFGIDDKSLGDNVCILVWEGFNRTEKHAFELNKPIDDFSMQLSSHCHTMPSYGAHMDIYL